MARLSERASEERPLGAPATGIRAAVFEGPGQLTVGHRQRPRLASPADVLVAVEACGICGTDLHILDSPPGHPATPGVVLGHELVGRIAEVGPAAAGITVGQRVVVSPNLSCGNCRRCRAGLASACAGFTTIGIFRDGGLADLVCVPAWACHPVSDDLPGPVAALAEPLSCVVSGIARLRPLPGEVAIIHGAGAIGLLFLAVLRSAGVRCVVAEPVAGRRERAVLMGAAQAVGTSASDIQQAVAGLQPDGADFVVDAVGTQFAVAIDEVRPGGKVLLFGMDSQARPSIAQNDITRRDLVIYGSYAGDRAFPATVRLLESGLLDLTPVISHLLPLERSQEAVDALRAGKAVKVVVEISADSPGFEERG
jgi:threonine dehydrogenase-like Zn-dependent dehydrogenase